MNESERIGTCAESGRSAPPVTSRARSSAVGVLTIGLVLTLLVAAVATPVAAHAYLSDSDPGNGEQVASAPAEVTLYFSGDGVQTVDVWIRGPSGEDVSGDARVDADDSRVVHAPLEDDGDGVYTVRWEILSNDGHTTSGSFFFAVGDEPLDRDAVLAAYEDSGEDEESVSAIEAGAKGLALLGLLGLVGVPITAWVVVYPLGRRSATPLAAIDRRVRRLLAGSAALLLASVLALGLVRSRSLAAGFTDAIGLYLGTSLGQVWLVQLAVSVAVVVVLVGAIRGVVPRRGWIGAAIGGGLLVAATVGWSSHSATAIDRLQGGAVDAGHVVGAGLWVGGLVVLATVVPAVLRETEPGQRAPMAAAAIRRFSIVALTGVTLAVLAGLLLAAWHAPAVEGLSETVYGAALSVKVLLVLVGIGLGGFTRYVLLRRLEPGRERAGIFDRIVGGTGEASVREDGGRTDAVAAFTRSVRIEIALLVLVVVLSGVLTSVPTAAIAGQDDGPQRAALTAEVQDVEVELSALPSDRAAGTLYVAEGDPVVYEVAFAVDGERRPSDRTVQLLAYHEGEDLRIEVDLEETGDGTYATVQTLPATERWELRITGTVDGAFVGEWFDGYVVPAEHAHAGGEEEREETGFASLLRVLAIVVGLVGSAAVVSETVRFGRREG